MPYEILEAESKSPGYEVLEPEQPTAPVSNPVRDALLAKQKELRESAPAGRVTDAAYEAVESLTPHGLASWPTRMWNLVTGSKYPDPDTSKPIINLQGVTEDALTQLQNAAGYPNSLAGPDSPILGIGQAVEETASGLTSPEGLIMLPAAATPVGRAVLAADMLRHVPEQLEESREVINDPNATVSDAARALTIPAIGVAGSVAMGPRPAPLPKFINDPVELAAIKGASPTRRLGVRVGPNALEGAELQALADQGMREAASPIVVPGEVAAVELLRRQQQPIIQPGATALLDRPGGGEAMGGKVSFAAPAEARSIPSARQSAVREIPPEPPPEMGGTPVEVPPKPPTSSPNITEGIDFENIQRPHRAGVERGLTLSDKDVPSLEAMKTAAYEEAMALSATDPKGFKAAFGKGTYIEGVLEGAKKKGPNYDFYLKEQAESSPAVETTKTGSEALPADDIIAKIQKWKYAEDAQGKIVNPQGQLFSLPHPEAIKAIGKGVWNNALDVAIVAIKTGRAVGEAVEAALAYVRKNASGGDETQLRANLNSVFANEKITGPKSYPVQGKNVEMRKSAARAAEAESFPKPVREKIAKDPDSFYPQQSTKEVSKLVGSMPDLDLASVPKNSDMFVAASLERAKRLFDAGKNDEGYSVFVELEKEGTRLGQLINQFKMLDGASPTAVATVVDRTLRNAKRDPLNSTQRGTLIGKADASISANRALDSAKDAWMKDPTLENAAKADKAMDAVNAADLEVQRMVNQFTPKTIPGTLKSILQGNLLTPISEVANLIGNLSFLPFRSLDRSVAASLDVIDAFVRNRPREVAVSPVRGTIEAAKGAARGLAQVPGILRRGSGDTVKGEKSTGLQPLRAWADQFAKNPDLPMVGGKLPFSERVRLALEGTFGMPAAVLLRGLQAGDQPFRLAAQARIIANEAKLKGIKGDRLKMAQKFPELFFDRETLKRIQEETLYSVFQRHSKSLNYISNLLSSRGPWVDLAATVVAPYKLTPWNIVSEILSYNPIVAAFKTTREATSKSGSSRAAKMNAGKFVVGSILTGAGIWLYKKGLLAPSLDTPDEQQKSRILAGEVLPPNHINLSGLERGITPGDGDTAFRPGDKTVDVFRAGGLAGSFLYMTANIGRDMEKQPAGDDAMFTSVLRNSTLEQARFGVNQSFLQGVGGLLQAIKSGETDSYMQSLWNTVLSVPMPNTLSALSRATRPEKIESKGFENLVRARLGAFGLDDKLPLKRGLWGEPIPETPEDRNAIIYHFFDITKSKNVTDDPVAIEIYKLWRKTGSTSVIPTPPERSVTIQGKSFNLTPEQQSRYAELVGKNRRFIVDALFANPSWKASSDEDKIKVLEQAYSYGSQYGKGQFWEEFQGKLESKPERSGFQVR